MVLHLLWMCKWSDAGILHLFFYIHLNCEYEQNNIYGDVKDGQFSSENLSTLTHGIQYEYYRELFSNVLFIALALSLIVFDLIKYIFIFSLIKKKNILETQQTHIDSCGLWNGNT